MNDVEYAFRKAFYHRPCGFTGFVDEDGLIRLAEFFPVQTATHTVTNAVPIGTVATFAEAVDRLRQYGATAAQLRRLSWYAVRGHKTRQRFMTLAAKYRETYRTRHGGAGFYPWLDRMLAAARNRKQIRRLQTARQGA